jgi:hypothetical protein
MWMIATPEVQASSDNGAIAVGHGTPKGGLCGCGTARRLLPELLAGRRQSGELRIPERSPAVSDWESSLVRVTRGF